MIDLVTSGHSSDVRDARQAHAASINGRADETMVIALRLLICRRRTHCRKCQAMMPPSAHCRYFCPWRSERSCSVADVLWAFLQMARATISGSLVTRTTMRDET